MESNIFSLLEKKNVAEIPIRNVIENLIRLENGFCEDQNSSKYWCYIFLKQKGQNCYIYSELKKWDGQTHNHNFEISLKSQNIKGDVEELKLFIRQVTDENESFLNDVSGADKIQIDVLPNLGFTCLDGKFCLDQQSGSYKLDELMYADPKGTKFSVIKSTSNELKNKKIYMTVEGKKCEVSFQKGILLKEKEELYFDALYIFEQAKNKVIKNSNKPKIKMANFIKSNFFDDDKWHFDDFITRDLEKEGDFRGCYVSQYNNFYGGGKRTVNIKTNELKVFVGSLCFETENFNQLRDSAKMQILRDNGFVEVDLYEISYLDQKTKKYITKKVFLTPDFSESDTIDESIVAIEEDQSNVVGKMYETPNQKEKVWEKLKNNSIIVSRTAWVTMYASFEIDRLSLATFLGGILGQDDNLRDDNLRFELVINGELCEKQSNAFSLDYKNRTEKIAVEHNDGIYSLCVKVFRGENENPIKPFLFLQKNGEDLCIFAGNKITSITAITAVTENKPLSLNNFVRNFCKSRFKIGLKEVSNNSFCIPELSYENKIELATPGAEKPMQINSNEKQK